MQLVQHAGRLCPAEATQESIYSYRASPTFLGYRYRHISLQGHRHLCLRHKYSGRRLAQMESGPKGCRLEHHPSETASPNSHLQPWLLVPHESPEQSFSPVFFSLQWVVGFFSPPRSLRSLHPSTTRNTATSDHPISTSLCRRFPGAAR